MSKRTPTRTEVAGPAEILLSHLDSAYNLARWLVPNGADAEDVVHEAYLRALQYSDGFGGGDARTWLLTIVRNTAYTWLRKRRALEAVMELDEQITTDAVEIPRPEQQLLLQKADRRLVEQVMSQLPVRLREILILRELEGFSYREIADVTGVPIDTVMSTLSRARATFHHAAIDLLKTHESQMEALLSETA